MGADTITVGKDNFEQLVTQDGILLLDWWAEWCGPCKAFAPVFDAAAAKFPDVKFGKINVDEQPELAEMFQIRSIPTLMVFRDRVLVFAQPGALPANVLEELITKVQALDMAEVRKDIANAEAEANKAP